jgi:hypothetical protein
VVVTENDSLGVPDADGSGAEEEHLAPDDDLSSPGVSTPLEGDEPSNSVPPAPLWAMKDRRHFFGLPGHGDVLPIRESLGSGDETIYFIDDGNSHCMVGRRVGRSPDGCVYCLVGRIKIEEYEDLNNGTVRIADAFSAAHDISLCGVFEDESWVSDVTLFQHYAHSRDVPSDYLPPSPFIEFTEEDQPVEI